MRAPKKAIQRAEANGSMQKVNYLLSAAYLLTAEANNLIEEAADVLRRNGLLIGELKKYHGDFVKSADRFFQDFQTMIDSPDRRGAFFKDLEDFDVAFRKWSKILEIKNEKQGGHDL